MATRNIDGVNFCVKSFDELGINLDDFVRNLQNTIPATEFDENSIVSPRDAVATMIAQNPDFFNDPQKADQLSSLQTLSDIAEYKTQNNLKLLVKPNLAEEVISALSRVADTTPSGFDSDEFVTSAEEILASCELDTDFNSPQFETTPEEILSVCDELPTIIPTRGTQLQEPQFDGDAQAAINELNRLADQFRPTEENNACANECGDVLSQMLTDLKASQDEFIEQLENYSEIEQRYFYLEIIFEYIKGKYLTYKTIKGEFDDLASLEFELKQRQAQGEDVASEIQELALQRQELAKSQIEFYSPEFGFSEGITTQDTSIDTLSEEFGSIKSSLEDDFSDRLGLRWDDFVLTYEIDSDSDNLPSKGAYPRFYELVEALIPEDTDRLAEPDFIENYRAQEAALRQSVLLDEFERQRQSFKAFGSREAKILVRFEELEGGQINQNQDLTNQLLTVLDNLQNAYDTIKERRDLAFDEYQAVRGRIEDADNETERVRAMLEELPCYDCQEDFEVSAEVAERFDANDTSLPTSDEPDPTKLGYWQRFALNATTASVLNPLSWSVGLLLPTPAGVLKVPLPTVWLALAVIPMPFGIWVVFLGINGIVPSPFLYEVNFITGGTSMFRFGLRGANQTITVLDTKDTDKVKSYTTSLLSVPKPNSCEGTSFFESPQLSQSKALLDLQKDQLTNPTKYLQGVIPPWSLLSPSFLNQETIRSFAINNEPSKGTVFVRDDLPSYRRLPKGLPLLNPAFTRYIVGFVNASKNLSGFLTPPSPFPYL